LARTFWFSTVFIMTLMQAAWTIAAPQTGPKPQPSVLNVPGYDPGVAGHVTLSPIMPVCQVGVPCSKPFAGATVQILDSTRDVVGSAVTNTSGAFIVSVPHGQYLIHIPTVDFPRCPEVPVIVDTEYFTLVNVQCDTGIR
jgi:hypothetical protein